MPIDQKQLDGLLEEIKRLEKKKSRKVKSRKPILPSSTAINEPLSPVKKTYLLPTEKNAYFHISHHYKLTMISIDEPGTALAVWLKGILPLLLVQHGIEVEEWERICDIGDNDPELEKELDENWEIFFKEFIENRKIDSKILSLINEGKERVKKMRKQQ